MGEIPDGMVVNHIDNNPLNNRLDNLELCTVAENNRRAKTHTGVLIRNTSSTVTGITFRVYNIKYQRYIAHYSDPVTNKQTTKTFSCIKYGKEEALRLAQEWRNERIAELNLQGAGYTDRHGT